MSKILYAASTMSHINNFHMPYINALCNDGHTVYVMARGDGADFDIPFEKKLFSRKNAKCRREIKKILRRESFDAVILNTTLAAFHIRYAMRGKGRPRVVNIVHGYLFSERSRGIKKRLLLFCERLLRKKTDTVLVMNGEDMKIASENRLSKNPPVMTLGMGATCKSEQVSREAIRREYGAENSFVLSFVGELSDRKNQVMLINTLSQVKEKIPNAVLWLIGEGDKRDEQARLAAELGLSDSVVFMGRKSNPCDFIRASDMYVSAARIEGMPFNLIEALGTGITIAASDIKGHADLINNGDEGFLYEPENSSALSELIVDVYCGKLSPNKEKMQKAYKKYSFDNVFESTLQAIKEAALNE